MRQILLIALVFVAISFANAAGIYVGVIDGYAHYLNGSTVAGVNVTVYVDGCSGEACSGSYLTESSPASLGYYVIGNLNIPTDGTVDVVGTKGIYYGSISDAPTANFTAMVNLTLVAIPEMPTLTRDMISSHNQTVQMSCTPGADSNGLVPYVEVVIDGDYTNATLYNETNNLDFGSHSWQCRTCNGYVCSDWVYDAFTLINLPPTAPTLVNQNDTMQTTVTLNWTSGIDPEGDLIYDEYTFNSTITSPATYPRTETGLIQPTFYTWGVRTCDIYDACSSWVYDTFMSYPPGTNVTCPPCDSSGGTSGTGGGGVIHEPGYNIFISYPYYVYQNEEINITVFVNATVDLNTTNFTILPEDLSIKLIDSEIVISNKTASMYFIFNTSIETPKNAKFTFIADKNKTIVLQKEFYVDVKSKPLQEIFREEQIEYIVIPILPLEILMFVIVTIIFVYYYKQITKEKNKH